MCLICLFMKKILFVFKSLTLVFLLSIITSCKTQNEVEEIELKSYFKSSDIPFMRFPYRIDMDANSLILFDMASDSMFYHILRYPDLTYLQSIGKKGSAPDEIILPTPFQLCNGNVVLLDGAKTTLLYYNNSTSGQFSLEDRKDLGLPRSVDFVMANDSVVYIEDLNGESRIIKVSLSGKEELFHIPYTDTMEKGNAEIASLWRSFMAYNVNTDKLALVTQFGDVLEIYDLKIKTSKIVIGEGGQPKKDGQIEGYHDIKWRNNMIYALYSGRSRADLVKSFKMGHKEPDGGNIIKVFNEDGNLIKQYHLDCFINGFTIDDSKKLLLGITSNQDESILYFDLDE